MSTLVVIVGPIASGKSTIAGGLAQRLRALGRPVAVLDLDELVETIGGFAGLSSELFGRSQVVFGQLVGAWLAQGLDVIAHGPFFDRDENQALLGAIPRGVTPRRVLLRSTLAAALERVRDDPQRGLSKNPDFLESAYQRADKLLPTIPPCEWTFDTTTTDQPTIIDELARSILEGEPGEATSHKR